MSEGLGGRRGDAPKRARKGVDLEMKGVGRGREAIRDDGKRRHREKGREWGGARETPAKQ